ncbi:peptidylprolyl isomerase [Ancylobacter sp. 6x-1]|uniref:Parvulin-like PPIase n=1 Tax=Ancylobacter crimeensis TaxID=2579147 RepID=A0ABT0DER7_9HYPH|nr:peptidylprolyl isomerase [Ancylobacter crimeensis]MCK0198463.1 peptidylprolyl isomerase [Ancylobacter crimeensis]
MQIHHPRAALKSKAATRTGRGRSLVAGASLAALLVAAFANPSFAQTPAAPATPAPAASAAPAATGDDPVLATVNGVALRKSDLAVAEEELGNSLPAQLTGPAREEYVLGFLIDMTALAQSAEADKLADSPDFQKQIDFARKRILMQAALTKATKAAITEDAMKATYEDAVKKQKPEQEVHARHILFRVADPKDEKASAAAKAKADEVEARLKKGEDFATIAKQLTEDPSGKENGGDLGFFTKDQMVPEFATVAFELKPGEVSAPVKTQFGWHVIKLEEKREKPVPTFEQVKPQIEQFLVQKAQADLVQKVREAAKVEKTSAAPSPGDLRTDAPTDTPPKTDAP